MGTKAPRESYVHPPLNKTARGIRVLDFLPELTTDGLIQCRQNIIALPDEGGERYVAFRALSYERGDPNQRTFPISVNDKEFMVHSNLHEFLKVFRKHIRKESGHPPVWIDAISIDQSNTNAITR